MSGPTFRLFVYGTLKRGYWNHDRFCRDALSIEPATVLGRLYELPSGIPVLEVPDQTIIAIGSAHVSQDAMAQTTDDAVPSLRSEHRSSVWRQVEGETILLPDPQRTIPPIDRIEGFDPRRVSIYRRVLVPAALDDGRQVLAWCYVSGAVNEGTARAIGGELLGIRSSPVWRSMYLVQLHFVDWG